MHTPCNGRNRNQQKTAKSARHECKAEKLLMAQRHDVGIAVGEYQGRGRGEDESSNPEVEPDNCDDDNNDDDSNNDGDNSDDDEATPQIPLLFFFDVETTGLMVYIIEIAAKVIDIPESVVSQYSYVYQSLIRTSKTIGSKGTYVEMFSDRLIYKKTYYIR